MAAPNYWTGAAWAALSDAAIGATYGGTYHMEYPEATARDGQGYPCGAVGNPRIVIRTPRMTGSGMSFWTGRFGAITNEYVAFDIEALNERDGSTDKMTGYLLWPRFRSVSWGSDAAHTIYHDVEIVIENCTVSSH